MTFKDELEKIQIQFETYLMTTGIDGINRDQALTSIINLVDKELPTKYKNRSIDPESRAAKDGYNQAIDDMRAIIRGNDADIRDSH